MRSRWSVAKTTAPASRSSTDVTVRDGARRTSELLTVSFRYKQPTESESQLLSVVVKDGNTRFAQASNDFRFSAAGGIWDDSPRLSRDAGFIHGASHRHRVESAGRLTSTATARNS
jgi:hypothetical protein